MAHTDSFYFCPVLPEALAGFYNLINNVVLINQIQFEIEFNDR